jgi:hypothetical protein
MTEDVFQIVLPLFDASDPVTAALEDPEWVRFEAVVSTDGSDFWLHTLDELAAAREQQGDSILLSRLRNRKLPKLETGARPPGIDLLRPTRNQIDAICRAMGEELVVVSTARSLAGRRTVSAFVDQSGGILKYVRSRYECSKYKETYPESVYKAYNGKCPKHKNATLSLKP